MYSFVKRNILIALIGVFPMVVGVESAAGHSGGGTSGSSGGHGGGGGHGNAGIPGAGQSGAHSSIAATSAHMSVGHLAASQPHETGDFPAGRFVHTGPVKTAEQRQFASGYVPNNSVNNDDWRKRHHYRRVSSP
jgi:hypothetical protein